MQFFKYHCFLILFSLLFAIGCGNQGSGESESAKLENERLRAEADSLKALLEEKNNEPETEDSGDNLPTKQVRETGKVNPVDEGLLEPEFVKFREDWLAAVDRKDVEYILKHTDPEIKYSFGAEGGIQGFRELWFSGKPENSEFWVIMKKIMNLGGTFDNKDHTVFLAPYVFTTFPSTFDEFTHAAITGKGVRLRDSPSRNGKMIGTLSFDVVQWFGESSTRETIGGETHAWVKVRTLDSLEGYVFGKFIHSPVGFRAGFEKAEKGWQMYFFIAGD